MVVHRNQSANDHDSYVRTTRPTPRKTIPRDSKRCSPRGEKEVKRFERKTRRKGEGGGGGRTSFIGEERERNAREDRPG